MSSITGDELQRGIEKKFRELPPAPWVREMMDHYHRTGAFRPEDLRRLLGDPNRAVEVGPNVSLSTLLDSARLRLSR
ncbi:MAG: hypothetical protein KJ749_15005 [Planctomycetes bacterium]|nr:hypothetical protein [Planctomycetota bacterium]